MNDKLPKFPDKISCSELDFHVRFHDQYCKANKVEGIRIDDWNWYYTKFCKILLFIAPTELYLKLTRKAEAANGNDQKKYPYAPTVNVAPAVYLTASIKLDEFPISLKFQTWTFLKMYSCPPDTNFTRKILYRKIMMSKILGRF